MSESLFYRAGTIKRQRRTKAALGQLDDQIMAVLIQDHSRAASGRPFWFRDEKGPADWVLHHALIAVRSETSHTPGITLKV